MSHNSNGYEKTKQVFTLLLSEDQQDKLDFHSTSLCW